MERARSPFAGPSRERLDEALALQRAGRLGAARDAYIALARETPADPDVWRLLGLCHLQSGQTAAALEALERAVEIDPRNPLSLSNLATAHRAARNPLAARVLYRTALRLQPGLAATRAALEELHAQGLASPVDLDERDAQSLATAVADGRAAEAYRQLVGAMARGAWGYRLCNLAGNALAALGRGEEAATCFAFAAELAPERASAHLNHAKALYVCGRLDEAREVLLRAKPHFPTSLPLLTALAGVNRDLTRLDEAIACAEAAGTLPDADAACHILRGNLHKTAGDTPGSVRAYRAALAADPTCGEAWWSLANLKNHRFDGEELAAMEALRAREDLGDRSRALVEFALAQAREDAGDYDAAFAAMERANRLRRTTSDRTFRTTFDRERFGAFVRGTCEAWTPALVAGLADGGHRGAAPIFVVSLPRSGSTLVDQIVSAHSRVTATDELPYARQLAEVHAERTVGRVDLVAACAQLTAESLERLGRAYVDSVRRRYAPRTPQFTDKMPNNFELLGTILTMLPEARIVNVERHPLDVCISCYKQLFAHGQEYSYDLEDFASYYEGYRTLLRHWHALFPGRILDVGYERLVTDGDAAIARLLDWLELPHERACFEFHGSARAVPTASAMQVRQKLYRGAVGRWRHYAAHLEPVRARLEAAAPPQTRLEDPRA